MTVINTTDGIRKALQIMSETLKSRTADMEKVVEMVESFLLIDTGKCDIVQLGRLAEILSALPEYQQQKDHMGQLESRILSLLQTLRVQAGLSTGLHSSSTQEASSLGADIVSSSDGKESIANGPSTTKAPLIVETTAASSPANGHHRSTEGQASLSANPHHAKTLFSRVLPHDVDRNGHALAEASAIQNERQKLQALHGSRKRTLSPDAGPFGLLPTSDRSHHTKVHVKAPLDRLTTRQLPMPESEDQSYEAAYGHTQELLYLLGSLCLLILISASPAVDGHERPGCTIDEDKEHLVFSTGSQARIYRVPFSYINKISHGDRDGAKVVLDVYAHRLLTWYADTTSFKIDMDFQSREEGAYFVKRLIRLVGCEYEEKVSNAVLEKEMRRRARNVELYMLTGMPECFSK